MKTSKMIEHFFLNNLVLQKRMKRHVWNILLRKKSAADPRDVDKKSSVKDWKTIYYNI